MPYFDRKVSVTIARPLPTDLPATFFTTLNNAIVVEDLRVQFKVQRSLKKEPNTCEIVISNLSEATRSEIKALPLQITLDAGYDGSIARLFRGDLAWSESRRVGADWETKMVMGDGARAYKFARVSRGFKPGTNKKTIINEAAKAMGVTVPSNIAQSSDLLAQESIGYTLHGPARTELDRIAKSVAKEWSIQDGELVLLGDNEARDGVAYRIAEDNGMIGSPEFGAPAKKGKPPVLKIRALLRPEITPGRKIQVDAEATKGFFKVIRTTATGDSRGQSWYSEIEAIPL